MPSAFGGFATGLASGVELGDRLAGREEERELRSRADLRAESELGLRQAADVRAGESHALAQEKGQLDVAAAREEEKYKLGRKAHMAQWMYNQKTKDAEGNDIPAWKLAYERGVAMADYDLANGKISAADQMKFAEYRKTTDDKEIQEAFGHLWARQPQKAKAFLDKFGAVNGEFSADGETLTLIDKDGKKTEVPTNLVAAGIGSPLPEKKLALEKTKAEIQFIKERGGYYKSMGERNEDEKFRTATNTELNTMYGERAKGIERRLARLDQDEAAALRVEGQSEAQRTEIKRNFSAKRDVLEKESNDLHNEAGHVGTIVSSAREAGHKIDARTARGWMEEAARGGKNIVITDSGRVGYKKGDKLIELPNAVVPRDVMERLKKERDARNRPAGAGASAPAAAPVVPPARPGLRPLAEREAEIARMNALSGGGKVRPRALTE